MKPEKPKKAKSPAKRTLKSVKEKISSLFKRKPAAAKPAAAPVAKKAAPRKKAEPAKPPPLPMKVRSTVLPSKAPVAPPPAKAVKRKAAPAPLAPAPAKKLALPAILLEGDAPPSPRPSGPGDRYVLGMTEPALPLGEGAELPEAYGTERLLLVARDPHWLYAHWDLTNEQLRKYNKASRDGHLVVRVFRDQPSGKPVVEQHVHPESRNWFLHVGRGGQKFVAQLGYFDRGGDWQTVSTSAATLTPPDALSDDTSVRFETIPLEVPFKRLLELVKGAVAEHLPLVEVIRQLRELGYPELPAFQAATSTPEPGAWTPEQERALAQVVSIDEVRRVWMGSLEITELLRRSLEQEMSSQAAAMLAGGELSGAVPPGGLSSVSSPFGGGERRKGFWFNVNAELIIYGATEPDATVTIGGRKIQLRGDGTFSFRFALPDGKFALPVQAVSADGDDARSAALEFSRATAYRGDVGRHPQDKALKAPRPENVS